MKYNLIGLTEQEVLILREGLFCFYRSCYNSITEKEFKEIDKKLNGVFK